MVCLLNSNIKNETQSFNSYKKRYLIVAIYKLTSEVVHCPLEFSSEEEAAKYADAIFDATYYKIKIIHIEGNQIIKIAPPSKIK